MLAVLALLTVACTLLAAAASRGMAGARERQVPGDLLQELQVARLQAHRDQTRIAVNFDVESLCFWREGNPRRCLPANSQWRLQVAASIAGSPAAVHFYPDGSSTGGNIQLHVGGQASRINISWLTGLATLQSVRP